MTADPRVVYGADRIRTRFNVVDTEHPGGHHGQDFSLPAGGGSEVVAYTTCTVVESGIEVTRGFTAVLGWYVVARTPLGRYLGWAHLRRGTRAPVGRVLRPGDTVGLAASGPRPANYQSPEVAAYDYPGTAWAGAHIHTTNGSTITSIFSGVGLIDPLPDIRAALASLASDSGTLIPITTAPTPQEDDLLADERAALFHIYNTLTPGIAGVKNDGEGFARTKAIQNAVGVIYDALTPGVQGVKFDGDILARLKALQAAIATVTERQLGYGARDENQDKILPLILDAVTKGHEVTLSDAQVAALGAKLDDDALARLAKAVNDERDARERARLAK